MFSTYSLIERPARLPWKRLIWLVLITLYAGLFFYNCLSSFRFWPITYLYTMFFIIWLDSEYYEKRLFLQSGFLPAEIYDHSRTLLFVRFISALFFYSAFILGVATVVWWPRFQISAYPFSQILGMILLVGSVYLRHRFLKRRLEKPEAILQFFPSLVLLLYSMVFGYASLLLLVYVTLVGLPVFFLQIVLERNALRSFVHFAISEQNAGKITEKNYLPLWEKFIGARSPRRKK
jgi:hypothetical protein